MNPILLRPTDVLFFRDGRPMTGSLSGHGAAWPLPNVINHAFHAALHRAGLEGVHAHRRGRSGVYDEIRDRKFGSLTTGGPFPVKTTAAGSVWFFPRPLDSGDDGILVAPMKGVCRDSSLPAPLKHAVASCVPPSKDEPARWWSEGAWNAYLGSPPRVPEKQAAPRCNDRDFADTEHTYGIGIDSSTGTVEEGMFYSASYLRLHEDWRLGVLTSAPDKDYRDSEGGNDLIGSLLEVPAGHILVGGQQRVCTAARDTSVSGRLPLPLGMMTGFPESDGCALVKWSLLSPAVFPQINHHQGGWLPSWIDASSGSVLLLDGPGANRVKRRGGAAPGRAIPARLVAAVTGKPLPISGWALPNGSDRDQGGAKPVQLAVPAGSVYFFACESPAAAETLASVLNWHGATPGTEIRNRRSTLMGEKGFGLGVCSSWAWHPASARH